MDVGPLLLRALTRIGPRADALRDVCADYLDMLLCEMSEGCCMDDGDDRIEPGTEDGCPDETVIFPKREER